MKKRNFVVLIMSVVAIFCLAFGLTACGGRNEPTHTHNYRWVDNGDGTHKQHCFDSGCTVPDINNGSHDYGTSGVCVCGKKKPSQSGENPPEHKHTYSDKWTSAGAEGHYHLANCEHTDEHTDIVPHIYDNDDDTTCNDCGYEREVLVSHTHNLTTIAANAATCTTDGNIAYWYCSGCEKCFSDSYGDAEIMFADTVIGKFNHDIEYVVAQAPTCVSVGWDAYEYCIREDCGYTTKSEKPATSIHTGGTATCTEKAICEVCYAEYGEIDADNHDIQHHEAQAATCTADGWDAYDTCSRCSYTTITILTKLNHDIEYVVAQAPTCVSAGWDAYEYCIREDCGYTTKSEKPATSIHTGGTATCTEKAICEVCYAEYGEIDADNHDIQHHEAQAATCTADGWDAYDACKRNGCNYTTKTIIPKSHTVNEYTVCTVCGVTVGTAGLQYSLNDDGESYSVSGIGTATGTGMFIASEYEDKPVTTIARSAFYNCSSITNIMMPNSVTSIGDRAFYGCSGLVNITISDGVTSIGDSLFWNCSSLASVIIPNSITKISSGAFYGCRVLEEVRYMGNLKDWCVISGLANLMQNGTSTKTLYINEKEMTGELVIPNGITTIPSGAFYNCGSLTSITIPNSVTNIESNAFCNCSSITNIIIPNSVTSIGDRAFYGCSLIEEIKYTGNITDWCAVGGIGNLTQYGKSDRTLYIGGNEITGELIIPNNITSIPWGAFCNCSSLTNVIIPNSVVSIARSAFENCTSLESIMLPFRGANTTFGIIFGTDSISDHSKYVPSSLKTVIITDGTSIGDSAFYGCSSITSITIPDSITSIDNVAFKNCSSLEELRYTGNIQDWCAIKGLSGLTQYGKTTKRLYINGNEITGELNIPNGVADIPSYAFYGCSALTSVTIPEGVTNIGYSAFGWCSNLANITIPNSVTSIEAYAFNFCDKLQYYEYDNAYYLGNATNNFIVLVKAKDRYITSCAIHEDTKFVYSGAFTNCSSLQYNEYDNAYYLGNATNNYLALIKAKDKAITSCVIHETTKIIYGNAFYGCNALTSVTIPDGTTNIGGRAFYQCSALTSITIPSSITSIGDGSFEYCSSLEEIRYTGGIKDWCAISGLEYLMRYGKLTKTLYINGKEMSGELVIPNDMTEISAYAFYNCGSITSVVIPNSVTSIGSHAFYGCSGLVSITIPNNVTSIEEYAFSGCTGLVSVIIPNSVTSIGKYAFYKCSSLESITLPFIGASNNSMDTTSFGYIFGSVPDSLKTVILTDCTSIKDDAFSGRSNLTSITIPDGVISIGSYAFYMCSGLTSITIPNSVTIIGDDAFGWCHKLTSIVFNGTKEQWNSIEKGSKWDETTGRYTIICTDGKLDKNGNEITE